MAHSSQSGDLTSLEIIRVRSAAHVAVIETHKIHVYQLSWNVEVELQDLLTSLQRAFACLSRHFLTETQGFYLTHHFLELRAPRQDTNLSNSTPE